MSISIAGENGLFQTTLSRSYFLDILTSESIWKSKYDESSHKRRQADSSLYLPLNI